jgi:hypothetical protein
VSFPAMADPLGFRASKVPRTSSTSAAAAASELRELDQAQAWRDEVTDARADLSKARTHIATDIAKVGVILRDKANAGLAAIKAGASRLRDELRTPEMRAERSASDVIQLMCEAGMLPDHEVEPQVSKVRALEDDIRAALLQHIQAGGVLRANANA